MQKTPNVCGGDACIRNTRITVHGLVHYRQLGFSDQRLLEVIQGLTQEDLVAAWDYNADHATEIREAIRLNEEDDSTTFTRSPEFLVSRSANGVRRKALPGKKPEGNWVWMRKKQAFETREIQRHSSCQIEQMSPFSFFNLEG